MHQIAGTLFCCFFSYKNVTKRFILSTSGWKRLLSSRVLFFICDIFSSKKKINPNWNNLKKKIKWLWYELSKVKHSETLQQNFKLKKSQALIWLHVKLYAVFRRISSSSRPDRRPSSTGQMLRNKPRRRLSSLCYHLLKSKSKAWNERRLLSVNFKSAAYLLCESDPWLPCILDRAW